jgi:hypothetical protein
MARSNLMWRNWSTGPQLLSECRVVLIPIGDRARRRAIEYLVAMGRLSAVSAPWTDWVD